MFQIYVPVIDVDVLINFAQFCLERKYDDDANILADIYEMKNLNKNDLKVESNKVKSKI